DPHNPPPETPSTSGQLPIRPPLSSIEYDPNNPPPETPSQNEPVTVKTRLTRYKRVTIQLPLWKQHFYDFRKRIWIAVAIAICAALFCVPAYITQNKVLYLGIAFAMCIICFSFIWLAIAEGPPFKSDDKGNPIKPSYLLPQKLSNSSYDLLSDSQRKELLRQQEYLAYMYEEQNG
ncbi:unnamed protein product, partial [Larinioides sclopetarius]